MSLPEDDGEQNRHFFTGIQGIKGIMEKCINRLEWGLKLDVFAGLLINHYDLYFKNRR